MLLHNFVKGENDGSDIEALLCRLRDFPAGTPVGAQVQPLPLVGGDIIPPFIHQFFPGAGRSFDGVDADPQGITNFSGLVAMGYTAGTATDNSGKTYNLGTDIRVYQGDYVGAAASGLGFASSQSARHLLRNMN